MTSTLKYILFLILVFTFRLFAQRESIAVLPFESIGNTDPSISETVTAFVQNAIFQQRLFKVLERGQIDKILNEQKFQLTGLTDDAIEAGKLLSVNKLVIGQVSRLGKEFTIVIKLVNVTSGEVIKSQKRSAQIEVEDIDNELIDPMIELLFSVKQRSGFTIIIKDCIGVSKMDALSASDVWIQVLVGNKLIGRTGVIQNNNSPLFNARFHISEYSGEPILLNIYDHDISKDTFIGSVNIKEPKSSKYPIINIQDGQPTNCGQIEITFE